MRRFWFATITAAGMLAGCNGFPRTIPIREAETKPEAFPTYWKHAPLPVLNTATQRWLVQPGSTILAPAMAFQPVGSGPLLAARGDAAPFSMLFLPLNGRLHTAEELR